jgi:hypothetical protein
MMRRLLLSLTVPATPWIQGKARWAALYAESVHKGTADYPWDVLSVPETEWRVNVKNSSGEAGWILNPSDFKGMDSCG